MSFNNLRDIPYSSAHANKTCKEFRRVVRLAFKQEMISVDPFEGIAIGNEENQDRQFFITREVVDKLMEECVDPEFRLIIALARFGGLRIPSEIVPLKWSDVDWEKGLLHVTDVKRKKIRLVPLFPELKKYLDQLWMGAEEGRLRSSRRIETRMLICVRSLKD